LIMDEKGEVRRGKADVKRASLRDGGGDIEREKSTVFEGLKTKEKFIKTKTKRDWVEKSCKSEKIWGRNINTTASKGKMFWPKLVTGRIDTKTAKGMKSKVKALDFSRKPACCYRTSKRTQTKKGRAERANKPDSNASDR